VHRAECQETTDGYLIFGRGGFVLVVDPCLGQGLRGAGAEEMSLAYILSGLIAFALLIYLLAAMFWAEDL
jgi:K+-transporting ATPase KdpF subunit